MHRLLSFYILYLCIYTTTPVTASPIQSSSTINGQPSGLIYSLYQGKNALWVGGENGLFAITGSYATYYTAENSDLSNNFVLDLYEDENGMLWIATYGGGVNVFDPLTGMFSVLTAEQGLASNNCSKFSRDSGNLMYVSCVVGVNSIDIDSREIDDPLAAIPKESLTRDQIFEVTVSDKALWFSKIPLGLYRLDLTSGNLTRFSKDLGNLSGTSVSKIYLDNQKSLWVATESGLSNYLADRNQFVDYPLNSNIPTTDTTIRSLYEDKHGILWAAAEHLYQVTKQPGSLIDAQTLAPTLQQGSLPWVMDLSESPQGDIIAASAMDGLAVVPAFGKSVQFIEEYAGKPLKVYNSIKLNSLTTLLAADKDLYLYSEDNDNISLLKQDIGFINAMLAVGPTEIIVAHSENKLNLFNIQTGTFAAIMTAELNLPIGKNSQISGMYASPNGEVYIGITGSDAKGIYKGDLSNGFTIVESGKGFTDIQTDGSDNLLATSISSGVFILGADGEWHLSDSERNLEGVGLNKMYQDRQGTLWITTDGSGVGFFDTMSNKIKFLDESLVKGAKFIRDIVQDSQGYYWIMSNIGLLRVDLNNLTSIRLGKSEAIFDVDFEFNASEMLSKDKLLVVGNQASYLIDTRFANSLLNKRLIKKTQALVVEFQTSEKNKPATRQNQALLQALNSENDLPLTLDHKQYLFNLRFAANEYAERQNLTFEYRLTGLSSTWNKTNAGENGASYSTLPAGDYLFEVRVSDPRSNATQPITRLPIEVLPPFWLTWQAYLLYTLTLLATIFLFNTYRTRQLREKNIELEKAVAQRTTALNKSNQFITNLLQQKQSLFANVSHEFRTPLSLIVGPLETLLSKIKEPGLKKQVNLINRNASRLAQLVDQVLELAKLETSKNIPLRKYDFKSALTILTESFIPLAETRQQKLTLNVSGEGKFKLLEDSLEKIIPNLLSNAIKYTPEGGNISLQASLSSGLFELKVSDDGPGIDSRMKDKIFDRFTRLETNENIPGSGIGLALVKELAEANDGKVNLTSELGHGTTFSVTLPVSRLDDDEAVDSLIAPLPMMDISNSEETPDEANNSVESGQNESILIVEDNADMRTFISESLQKNYQCFTAQNGREGLKMASEILPDLIVSDVMMPEMNGFELAKAIKDQETTSHIPFVLLTAKGDQDSRIEGWQLNIDDYIGKPFSVTELQIRLSRLLSIRRILKRRYFKDVDHALENSEEESKEIRFENAQDQRFFDRFVALINTHFADEDFNRSIAAKELAVSERQLNRKLGALIDYNFSEYLRKFRLEKSKQLLSEGHKVSDVSYQVGFSSLSYFSSCFKAEFGLSPKAFTEQ